MPENYYESQYDILNKSEQSDGISSMGPMSSFTWNSDPRRLVFVLSRYKFVAKCLSGSENVLEVGCGDGFAARIVRQEVENLTLCDIDPAMLRRAKEVQISRFPVNFLRHDFYATSIPNARFDAIYLLDVLEHIDTSKEETFLTNIKDNLKSNGKIIVGMPSLESQQYASPASLEGHVNCKRQEDLSCLMKKIFGSTISFSMNDEVVQTGFARMANYIFSVSTKA